MTRTLIAAKSCILVVRGVRFNLIVWANTSANPKGLVVKFSKIVFLLVFFILLTMVLEACDEANPTSEATSAPGTAGSSLQPTSLSIKSPTPTGRDGRTVLRVWTQGWKGNPNAEEFLNKLIDSYHTLHPNFTLDWQDYGANTPNKLSEALPDDNNAPDLVLINPADLYNFAARNQLTDLDTLTGAGPDLRDKFVAAAWDNLRWDNHSYGIPWLATGRVTLINKNLWQQAGLNTLELPKTFDELNKNLATLRDKSAKDTTVAWLRPDPLADFMMEGVDLYEIGGDGKSKVAAFDSDIAEGRWQYYAQLRKSGYLADAGLGGSDVEALKLYSQNKLVMITDGLGVLPGLKSQYPELYKNTLVTLYPLSRGNVEPMQLQGWAIPAKARQKLMALDFVQYLATADNELTFAKFSDTVVPTLKTALTDSYVTSQSEPLAQTRALWVQNFSLMRVPETLLPQPTLPSQRDNLLNALTTAQLAFWSGKLSPKDALTQAAKTWNDLLK